MTISAFLSGDMQVHAFLQVHQKTAYNHSDPHSEGRPEVVGLGPE